MCQEFSQPGHTSPGEGTLLIVHDGHRASPGAPEQHRVRQCGQQRLERRWIGGILMDQSFHDLLDPCGSHLTQRRKIVRHRCQKLIHRILIDPPEPLRPCQVDERGEEPGSLPKREHRVGVVSSQSGARALRGLVGEQLENASRDISGLVDDVDMRTPAQEGEKPLDGRPLLGT